MSNHERKCEVCGREPSDTPMVFRNDLWCSDICRKKYLGEK